MDTGNKGETGESLHIAVEPGVVDFLVADEVAQPGHFSDEVWTQMAADPDTRELVYGALVLSSEKYAGHDPTAIALDEAFRTGVAYAANAFKESQLQRLHRTRLGFQALRDSVTRHPLAS